MPRRYVDHLPTASLGPPLETIAAQYDGQPCCAYMGPDGAGHFVKMIHNGIEYAIEQFIAETYDRLRDAGMEPARIAEVFRKWNTGGLSSYLAEITAEVLGHVDAVTGLPFVDVVVDAAEQKVTGRWAGQSAMELGVSVNAIAEAVFARSASGDERLRVAARSTLSGPERGAANDVEQLVEDLRAALWASMVVAYAQGLDELRAAGAAYDSNIDLATVTTIWRAGCIIRARLLEEIRAAYAGGRDLPTLLVAPDVADQLGRCQDRWRRVVGVATDRGVPVPSLSWALAYYDSVRHSRLPASLVQGMRDFFGRTNRRTDRDGVYHTLWSGARSEQRVR
jgi:6-phosphogluconate dehydrogenase